MNRSRLGRHRSIVSSCGGFAVLALAAACPAAVVNVTGTLATPAKATGQTSFRDNSGLIIYAGTPGGTGYVAANAGDTYQFNAVVTAGEGADLATGSAYDNTYYNAGSGGQAVVIGDSALTTTVSATFNGGTYTGGRGGNVSGAGGEYGAGAGIGRDALQVYQSNVTINGGTFVGGVAGGGSTNSSNFTNGNAVRSDGPGTLNVNGGTFRVGNSAINPAVRGYALTSALAVNGKNLNLRGGTFDVGQNSDGLDVFSGGSATLYGTAFVVNGQPVLTSGPVSSMLGTLTGLLQNNTALTSFSFARDAASPINLVIVPEPTAVGVLVGGAVLGLRRRRQA